MERSSWLWVFCGGLESGVVVAGCCRKVGETLQFVESTHRLLSSSFLGVP